MRGISETQIVSKEDASLRVVSLQKLIDGDQTAVTELLNACTELGFFYLNCNGPTSEYVVDQVRSLLELSVEVFDIPQEEKLIWAVDRDHDEHLIMGYKQAGHANGPVEGKKDGFEAFMLFEHALKNTSEQNPFRGPNVLTSGKSLILNSISSFRDISVLILTRLSQALGISTDEAFQYFHRKDAVCPTALGFLKYTNYAEQPDIVGQIAHTDAGSLSIVFTEVPGLQVLKPNEETWYYIAPKPGHAIVNIGDSLRFISKGVLECALHRVIPFQDEKNRNKYTIVYLLRPEMNAEFEDEHGNVWKGLEWTNKKHAVFRADAKEQAEGTFLTGRDGYVGHWDPTEDIDAEMITM
ncbi:2og-fe oxygenase family protein [Phlyctema vagabunda]|uniref:2og-fe oxygenase family protein n=1 Tax=Phlyctema vagabunda TaxID=108571 RepID=A0ABR4P1R9_9HELO